MSIYTQSSTDASNSIILRSGYYNTGTINATSVNAQDVGIAQYVTSDGVLRERATQGKWANNNYHRLGIIWFQGLRDVLKEKNITQIKFTIYCRGGSENTRALKFWESRRQTFPSATTSLYHPWSYLTDGSKGSTLTVASLGDINITVEDSGTDNENIIILNSQNNNNEIFDKFKNYFKNGNELVVIYSSETGKLNSGDTWTKDYTVISRFDIEITYSETSPIFYKDFNNQIQPCNLYICDNNKKAQLVNFTIKN